MRSYIMRGFWRTWTSFSFNETRWTISRRACLSGLALLLYASSRIILSLALYHPIDPVLAHLRLPERHRAHKVTVSTYAVRFRFPLGCFSISEPGRGLAAASASGGRICDVKDSS